MTHAEEQTESWYQIEYVLFEHVNSDRHVLRFEDVKYAPTKRQQYFYLTSNTNTASPFQLQVIDESLSDFTDILSRVADSNELRVFSKGSWQQAMKKGEKLPPLKISGGRSYNNGQRFQLEGELQIRRERYMHAEVDVYLADFKALPYHDLKNWFFEEDESKWPINWLLQPETTQQIAPSVKKFGESLVPENVVHFKQSRRIKDAEVHYIDHPALGLIITIKGIDPPFEYGEGSDGANS